MCLLSGQRLQTLVSLSTDCIYLNNSGCVFYISKLLKTSRPKSHQQPIESKAYPHDVSLCAVALIKLYLDKTAELRHDVSFPKQTSVIKNTGKVGIRYFTQGRYSLPKHLKLILSVQHRHKMCSVVACLLPKLQRQLNGQM